MGTRTITEDDFSGNVVSESSKFTVSFGPAGKTPVKVDLDLSKDTAAAFLTLIKALKANDGSNEKTGAVSAARIEFAKFLPKSPVSKGKASTGNGDTEKVREWAKAEIAAGRHSDWKVGTQGRLSQEIHDEYQKAHPTGGEPNNNGGAA